MAAVGRVIIAVVVALAIIFYVVAFGAPWHPFQHWVWSNQIHWAALLTAGGVVFAAAGAVFAGASVLQAARSRVEQAAADIANRTALTAADFSRRWDSAELLATRQMVRRYRYKEALYAEFIRLYYDRTSDEANKLLREPNYFEDLAILSELGAVEYDFIKKSLGFIVCDRWVSWQPIADWFWRRNGMDNYPHFRALAARLALEPDKS